MQDKPASDAPDRRMRRYQIRTFVLTWLSYASFYFTRKNFSVVKARLNQDVGMSVDMLGFIDTLYLALYALGQFVNGALGDRFGARRMLGFGMIGSAVLAWVFGASEIVVVMAVAFGLNGLFQSSGWPNGVKAMGHWFGRDSRGKVMGFWCTNYQVGGLLATTLATYLLVNFGWQVAFFVPGGWVAAVGAVVLLYLVERPRDVGLPEPEEGEENQAAPQPTADGTPTADGKPTLPEGFWGVLALPAVWALGGSYFGLKLIRYSLLFWLPFYLHNGLGYDEGVSGYLSTAFEAGGVLGAIATGWISDRFFPTRRARLLVPMLFGLAGALALYKVVGDMGIVANALSMGLAGFLLFGPDSLISGAAAQDLGGAGATGSAAGIINGMGSIGAVLQGIITAQVSQVWGWEALFYVFIAMAFMSGLALLPLALRKKPWN